MERRDANIFIDPDPASARAVRACERTGFRAIPDHPGRIRDRLLMRHDPAGVPPQAKD